MAHSSIFGRPDAAYLFAAAPFPLNNVSFFYKRLLHSIEHKAAQEASEEPSISYSVKTMLRHGLGYIYRIVPKAIQSKGEGGKNVI